MSTVLFSKESNLPCSRSHAQKKFGVVANLFFYYQSYKTQYRLEISLEQAMTGTSGDDFPGECLTTVTLIFSAKPTKLHIDSECFVEF